MKVASLLCFFAITFCFTGCNSINSDVVSGPGAVQYVEQSVSGQFNGFKLSKLEGVEYLGFQDNVSVFGRGESVLSVEFVDESKNISSDEGWVGGISMGAYTAETRTDKGYYLVTSDSEEFLGIFIRSMDLNGDKVNSEN